MLPRCAVERWANLVGIWPKIAAINQTEFTGLQDRFLRFSDVSDSTQARQELDRASPQENEALLLYLLSQALATLRDGDWKNARAFVEWALLCVEGGGGKGIGLYAALLEAMCRHGMGEPREAMEEYRKVIDEATGSSSPDDDLASLAHFCAGKLYAEVDDIERALVNFDQALGQSEPKSAVEQQERALTPKGDGGEGRSRERSAWHELIRAERDRSQGRHAVLEVLAGLRDVKEVQNAIASSGSTVDDDLVEVLQHRTIRCAAREDFEKANWFAVLVDRLNQDRGRGVGFLEDLGCWYLHYSRFAPAEQIFRHLSHDRRAGPSARVHLADAVSHQGRDAEAIEILQDALKSWPDDASTHSALGQIFTTRQQWDLARQHLSTALRLNPDDSMARQVLGSIPTAAVGYDSASRTLFLEGDPSSLPPDQLASVIMAAIVKGNPDRSDEMLAEIEREQGSETARAVAAMAFPRPDSPARRSESPLDIAERLFAAGEHAEAIEHYSAAIDEDPDNAAAYMGLGDCYYMMGGFELAAAHFEESVAIEPTASTLRFLGDAYLRLHELDEAIRAYERSVEANPGYGPARESLERARELKRQSETA